MASCLLEAIWQFGVMALETFQILDRKEAPRSVVLARPRPSGTPRHRFTAPQSESLAGFTYAPGVSWEGKGKDPVHLRRSPITELSQQRGRFQPAKAFLNPLPIILADSVAGLASGAPVDSAPATTPHALRHVWRDTQVPTLRHKLRGFKSLVVAYGHAHRSRKLFQQRQSRQVRGGAIGFPYLACHHQPVGSPEES